MRPERARASRPSAADDDQYGWLVTFSDLVLQLFAFVILALVASGTTASVPAPSEAIAAVEAVDVVEPEPEPDAEPEAPTPAAIDAAEVRAAVALIDAAAAPVETTDPVEPEPAAPVETAARAPERPAAAAPTAPRVSAPLDAQLAAIAAAHAHDESLRVTVRDSNVVFTLDDGIAFPSGSADLLPAAAPILAEIRRLAASLPQFTVDVAGHTDDLPIRTAAFPSNLELSLARAARVAREIAGTDPGLRARTVARGWGEFRPLAPNADADGRARNRRVEIRLVPADAG